LFEGIDLEEVKVGVDLLDQEEVCIVMLAEKGSCGGAN